MSNKLILTIAAIVFVAGTIALNYRSKSKSYDLNVTALKYEVKPICIGHVTYYTLGSNADGVRAITAALNKDGKIIECNF